MKLTPPASRPRLLAVGLALAALALTWTYLSTISRTDPWYRNTDMNAYNVIDAMGINSSIATKIFDQPGVPLKYLLALEYRALHYLGRLPAWNLETFDASPEPLREYSPLVHIARIHSRVTVLLLMVLGGGLIYRLTRDWSAACLGVILLGGSAGLLFHGLLSRPELLCVGFGNLLAFLAAVQASTARTWMRKHAWLFGAGIFIGMATLEKLPGLAYLGLVYGWCWLSALITLRDAASSGPPVSAPAGIASGLLPAAGALALLGMLFVLGPFHDVLGSIALNRMRVAAIVVAILPLFTLLNHPARSWQFLLERVRELALLASGVLAALPCMYLLLRAVMTKSGAGHFSAIAFHFTVYPDVVLQNLAPGTHVGGQFREFLRETPVLFASSIVLTLIIIVLPRFPLRLKAAVSLLVVTGVGLAYVMSRRYFSSQYSIYAQVPLLLAWTLVLSGLSTWWKARGWKPRVPWLLPLGFGVAAVLMITVYSRVQPKYYNFQDDAKLPVSHFTVTFLYDHDAHMTEYLRIMTAHYGNREEFTAALQRYLADPANRY